MKMKCASDRSCDDPLRRIASRKTPHRFLSTFLAHHKKEKANTMENIYSFRAKSLDGKEIDLSQYKGKVLLVVNTASNCGFTPQYTGLEELNKKYKSKGLEILGFPCNQFGAQEPGNSEEIASFCQKNYGVDLQMFEKVDVNGAKADPIYNYLTSGRSRNCRH